jgi:hypothetical protein
LPKRRFFRIFQLFALLAFAIASVHIIGCGKGVVLSEENSTPANWIESRYPAINGSVNSKDVNITITFNRDMNTPESGGVVPGPQFTEGAPVGGYTYWSDKRTFNIYVTGPFTGGLGNVVHLIATNEGFRDANGHYLPADTELWKFTYDYDALHSYSISGEVSQSSGTDEGIIYIAAYNHNPSSYDDAGLIRFTTLESPGPYSLSDLGHGSNYYVQAYRNVLGTPGKWYRGYPSDKIGSINLSSDQTNVDLDLTAQPLTIESVSPTVGSTGVAENYTLSVTFNNAIRDFSSLGYDTFNFGISHEVGMPTVESPPLNISDDLRTVYLTIEAWNGGTGNWVHIITSGTNRITDVNAGTLPDGTTLWKYEFVPTP